MPFILAFVFVGLTILQAWLHDMPAKRRGKVISWIVLIIITLYYTIENGWAGFLAILIVATAIFVVYKSVIFIMKRKKNSQEVSSGFLHFYCPRCAHFWFDLASKGTEQHCSNCKTKLILAPYTHEEWTEWSWEERDTVNDEIIESVIKTSPVYDLKLHNLYKFKE